MGIPVRVQVPPSTPDSRGPGLAAGSLCIICLHQDGKPAGKLARGDAGLRPESPPRRASVLGQLVKRRLDALGDWCFVRVVADALGEVRLRGGAQVRVLDQPESAFG